MVACRLGRSEASTTPLAGTGTSLHAEQHYEFHRPLRPGDVLTVTREQGESWEKQSKRAGTLRFSTEISYYRDQDGELVVTAKRVRVVTERKVDG